MKDKPKRLDIKSLSIEEVKPNNPFPINKKKIPLKVSFVPLVKNKPQLVLDNNDDINVIEYREWGYKKNTRIFSPEWDFDVIRVMYDTDSYFRRAVDKYVELVLGNDVEFISLNTNAQNYIDMKFRTYCDNMDISNDEFVESILRELILYANCFVLWKYKTIDGVRILEGFRILPAPDTKIEYDIKTHKITGYLYYGEDASKPSYYPTRLISHLKIFKHSGNFYGKPFVIPVLDDIRALRKLEEIIERDAFTYGHRFIHCQISTEEDVVYDKDVERIALDIDSVKEDGIFVSADKIKFEPIRVEDSGVPLKEYLEYFKNRVFAGLGTSAVGMGEGDSANRGTAIMLDRQTENMAKIFSSGLNREISFHIFRKILINSGLFKWKNENKVKLHLPAINIEEKIKIENHAAQMYAQHLITETEARMEYMSMSPLTDEDRKDMFFERVEKPLTIIKAVDEPYTEAAKAALNKGNNADQPSNQHGKKIAPTIPANDSVRMFDLLSYQIHRLVINDWEVSESLVTYFASYMYQNIGNKEVDFEIFLEFSRKFLRDVLKLSKENKNLFGRDYLLSVVQGAILSKVHEVETFAKNIGGTNV